MNYNQITIGIVSFKSEKVIFNCLKSIKKIKKIIILDNSNDVRLKTLIKKKYPSIKFLLSKKNLGYGSGNNLIIKKAKTPYVFILSPDVILAKNCEKNLLKVVRNLKTNFSILSPISKKNNYDFNIASNYKKATFEVEFVKGFAMLLNKKKIIKVGLFDENIFLYLEEIDLCRRVKQANQKIFITKEAKVTHLGAKSSNIGDEFEKCRNWHWMWSQFYFNKKVSNYFLAILKFLPKIFFLTLKVIFFYIVFNKYKSINSKMRLLGLLNSVIGNSSWYRPKII